MTTPRAITRGGVTVVSDSNGNLTIHARGDGEARVQCADVPDLLLALHEMTDVSAPIDNPPKP